MRPLFLFLALMPAVLPSTALASPSYPRAIASELDLPCEPACTLCHTQPTGGFATVNTPFGLTARMQHGLTCCSPALVADVLEDVRDAESDSDDDGSSDIDELEALTDPNEDEDADLACTTPEGDSGCSVRSPGAARTSSVLFVAAVFVGVAAAVRRRRLA
jgi:MYXO-CTERM domain-containing protein